MAIWYVSSEATAELDCFAAQRFTELVAALLCWLKTGTMPALSLREFGASEAVGALYESIECVDL